ncbi:uncharacterized protein P884DRAFT_262094 [Thermothelomyces heterothallicus CBS 202.75]|uniref:uncharacterized protein n=1 Tax=Thermothelomyces heterothallicus CBS 202.75 TaxID=1149848 RepID=UPI00374405D5
MPLSHVHLISFFPIFLFCLYTTWADVKSFKKQTSDSGSGSIASGGFIKQKQIPVSSVRTKTKGSVRRLFRLAPLDYDDEDDDDVCDLDIVFWGLWVLHS